MDDMNLPDPKNGPPVGAPKPDQRFAQVPTILSPPGIQAPVGLTNYTPNGRTLHPPGITAPKGDLNVTPLSPKNLEALRKALKEGGHMDTNGPLPVFKGGKPSGSPAPDMMEEITEAAAPSKVRKPQEAKPKSPKPRVRPPISP